MQEPLITRLSESLTRCFSSTCNTSVAVHPLPTYQLPFREFLLTLWNPTFLAFLGTDSNQVCAELSPPFAYLLLEHLLGRGFGSPAWIPNRPFSDLESRLLLPMIEQLVRDIASCSGNLRGLKLQGLHAHPTALHVTPAHEPVTVAAFELYIGRQSGRLTFSLPLSLTCDLPLSDDQQIDLRAVIAQTTLTMQELSSLQPGDIVTTQTPAGSDLTLVSAHHRLRGELVHYQNHRAVRITSSRRT